jgi:hypothetical protein
MHADGAPLAFQPPEAVRRRLPQKSLSGLGVGGLSQRHAIMPLG